MRTFFVRTGIAALVLAVPLAAGAAQFMGGDTVSVRSGEAVADDLYAGGGSVTVAGSVRGDLYAGGGTVLVSGSVGQDLVVGGGSVTILGSVGDDVRVGGGTITIAGAVASDVVVGGGSVHLAGSRIGGDVLGGGGVLRIETPVEGDARLSGGEVYLNSPISGSVEVDAEKLVLGGDAVIGGDLTYRSPQEATLEEGARVMGAVTYEPTRPKNIGAGLIAALLTAAVLGKLFSMLAAALFFVLLLPRYCSALVRRALGRPLRQAGRGFVFAVVLPVAGVLLMVTLVGIPLGVLLLLSFVAAMLASCLIAPIVFGVVLREWYTKTTQETVDWKSALLGVAAFFALGLVPLFGGLVQLFVVLTTFGALLEHKWELIKEWR